MKKTLIAAALAIASLTTAAHAEPLVSAVQVSLASWHSAERPGTREGGEGWCQSNPGILLEHGNYVAGAYHSSTCKPVWMAGRYFDIGHTGAVQWKFLAALDKGYESPVILAVQATYGHLAVYDELDTLRLRLRLSKYERL